MSTVLSPPSPLPPAWSEVVDRIQEVLDHALELLAEREGELVNQEQSESGRQDVIAQVLAQVDEQARNLDSFLRQASEKTVGTEMLIRESMVKTDNWLKAAADYRRRLAERAIHGIR